MSPARFALKMKNKEIINILLSKPTIYDPEKQLNRESPIGTLIIPSTLTVIKANSFKGFINLPKS